jgi:hypothetical protein
VEQPAPQVIINHTITPITKKEAAALHVLMWQFVLAILSVLASALSAPRKRQLVYKKVISLD